MNVPPIDGLMTVDTKLRLIYLLRLALASTQMLPVTHVLWVFCCVVCSRLGRPGVQIYPLQCVATGYFTLLSVGETKK